ncbi:MAG TPA: hypothetical protein VM716_02335 [Gemmatimonadales bacterium]|nr:hypothetical protein [Gemmatimonadales bacterium]
MDAFSYLSILLSIIIGLGLAQILTALGRIIRHRDRVRSDWLPLLWAVVLLVIYVQVWWSMFGLRHISEWKFVSFAAVLAQTASLYLMAAFVLPEQVGDEPVDLSAYYDQHHRWFFGSLLATLVISVVKDVIVNGRLPGSLNLGFHVFLAAASVSAILIRRRHYQEFVGIASAAAFVAYVGLLFTRLG